MSANAKEMKIVNNEGEKNNNGKIYSRRQKQSICSNIFF